VAATRLGAAVRENLGYLGDRSAGDVGHARLGLRLRTKTNTPGTGSRLNGSTPLAAWKKGARGLYDPTFSWRPALRRHVRR
jgi:hypothetical protein